MGKHDYFGWKVLALLLLILLGLIWTVRSQLKLPEGLSNMKEALLRQARGTSPQGEEGAGVREMLAQATKALKPPGSSPQDQRSQEEKIRVVLENDSQGGYYHQEAVLTASAPCLREDTGEQLAAAGEEVTLTGESAFPENGILRLTAGEGSKLQVLSLNRTQGHPAYEGTLEIRRTDKGLLLINEVDIETYLRYVVPSEMPASYQMEALKAQAVCARTYACKALEEGRMEAYYGDVDDTVAFQVYNNISSQERTDQAVAETAGKVMISGGQLISAYFFSTSCGHTSTDEVWNGETTEPYLKSTYLLEGEERNLETEEAFASFIQTEAPSYDSGETWYRWEISFPAELLQSRFSALDPQAGTLQAIQVKKRSSGGAVEELTLLGSAKSVTLTNEYRIREWLSPGDLPVQRDGEEVSGEMSLLPSAYFICQPQEEDGAIRSWSIQGGGYGHGVGMSQNGANQMAKEGKSWEEILRFFYQNIEITDQWS